jgi:hypothetical protein
MTLHREFRRWLAPLGLALLLGGLALLTPAVSAATQHVTDCGDVGANTLRGKIGSAASGETIVFDQDCTGATAIVLTTGTLVLTKDVTIDGSGYAVVVDGGCAGCDPGETPSGGTRVFTVNTGVVAALSGLTIQHGDAVDDDGGGILNLGTLMVANSTIASNVARSPFADRAEYGGGIFNEGTLVVTNSTFAGNVVVNIAVGLDAKGGGIAAWGGTTTVTGTTFSGNGAKQGGAIGVKRSGTVTVTNSTITRNSDAFFNDLMGTVSVTNATITGNNAGIFTAINGAASGATMLTNTILAGNGGSDVGGASVTSDHSLIGGTPLLGTLGNYGGTTQTIPLLPGSPAIGGGSPTACISARVSGTDQRGIPRPGIAGSPCDIGAFESRGFNLALSDGANRSTVVTAPFSPALAVTVASSHGEPVDGGQVTFVAHAGGGGQSATVTDSPATIASGSASVAATATSTPGAYTLTAAVATGTTPPAVTFNLTNAAVIPVVNSAGDGAANIPNCAPGNANTCRLRDAIAGVNAGGATGTAITFDGAAFPAGTPTTITLTSDTLTLGASMTIDGTGHRVAVDGGGLVTVFAVNAGVVATLNGLTIQHGHTRSGSGGGIANSGTLAVTNSTLSGNNAGFAGGIANSGTLTVTNSTLSGNTGQNGGGGIYNLDHGTLTVTNSTLSGNTANGGSGGGIATIGTLTVVTNTIVAGNTAAFSGPDLIGTITSGGHNLFGTTSGANITLGPGDIVNPAPLLGALGSNGGTTQTIPLLPGSPAIDAGNDAVCAAAPVGGKDQRGITRSGTGAHCDIGAFEYAVVSPLPPPKPPGDGAPSAPAPLPGPRPPGTTGGSAPNPLPVARP